MLAIPSLRYKQTVKYNDSFPTNLFGGTSTHILAQGPTKDDDDAT